MVPLFDFVLLLSASEFAEYTTVTTRASLFSKKPSCKQNMSYRDEHDMYASTLGFFKVAIILPISSMSLNPTIP